MGFTFLTIAFHSFNADNSKKYAMKRSVRMVFEM